MTYRAIRPFLLACAASIASHLLYAQTQAPLPHIVDIATRPNPPEKEIAGLVGDYGDEQAGVHTYERGGHLAAHIGKDRDVVLRRISPGIWEDDAHDRLVFSRSADAGAAAGSLKFDGATVPRRDYGAEADSHARSLFKVDEKLIASARQATPPSEQGTFRKADLVSLPALDPTIKLDIRYATPNNFACYPVYAQPAAFMQRPAAEAVVRAHRFLKQYGYGIAVHDSYRPWYVTKVFWDATPTEGKVFVADPAEGSRHNRGEAVDLTMYDLATGEIVDMPGRYDEMSARSHATYFGGTSLQRWRRDLLRYAMEQQGFEVYSYEWWHFDYKDWREYPILNVDFDRIS